jgi:hypothetical protein
VAVGLSLAVSERYNHADVPVAGAPSDVKEKYGDMTDEEYFKDLFKDGPTLCGQTSAYLASGRGKELRGLFLGMCLCASKHISANANHIQTAGKMLQSFSKSAVKRY